MKRAALLLLGLCACVSNARPAPQSPSTATDAHASHEAADDSVLAQSVRASLSAMVAEGYTLAEPLERGFLAPSARALTTVTLPARTCLAIVAAATPAIADLDAALYAADGSVLVEDDASDARPVVRFCTGELAVSAYLSLYAFQGTGTYTLARLTRPASEVDGRDMPAAVGTASAAFVELARTLRSRGYQDDGPSTDLPLVAGAPLRVSSKVAAGQCYSVIADGEQLRVRLLDEEGHEVAVGIGSHQPAALQYCAQQAGDFTLELSARGSERRAHVLRMRAAQSAVGGARTVWLGEPSAAAGSRFTAAAAAKVAGCGDAAEPLAEVKLAQGELVELALPRAVVGKCMLIDAQLRGGLSRATLRVESASSSVLSERELQPERGAVEVCALPASARLVLVGRAGFGSVTVERRTCDH